MSIKIAVVGTGYVGLVSGACFASIGHEVICIDNNRDKIEKLLRKEVVLPIYEPGLDELVQKNVEEGRLNFTTDLKFAVENSDIVFIAVGTPQCEESGQANLKYVHQVAKEIAGYINKYTVIVNKSTVPIGTGDAVSKIVSSVNSQVEFSVVSNPEFLREGFAIADFLKGDRVVVGVENARAQELMRKVYQPLEEQGMPVIFTKVKSAEMIKYAANAMLSVKLCFMNNIADLSERLDVDVQDVAEGIGLDSRIGSKFLQVGPGFGGSCFPKDIMALNYIASQNDCDLPIIQATIDSNNDRKVRMAEKIENALGGSLDNKNIGVLGLAFKGNTDDCRESPAIAIIKLMQEKGANITAFDPEAMEESTHYISDITYASNKYEVCNNADALVILTEWDDFKELDLGLVKSKLKNPVLVDLRNLHNPQKVRMSGIEYHSVGRP